jgi:hypothetical protein
MTTIRGKHIFMALIAGLAACTNLAASVAIGDDWLSIQLDPLNGAVHGPPGATVGWGFTITWYSTSDWIAFTGSSLGSVDLGGTESNPSLLSLYTDYLQSASAIRPSGPTPFTWTETFAGLSQGVGSYRIGDAAQVGAEDLGQITIYYDVWHGEPGVSGSVDLGTGSYYGSDTAFRVTVDELPVPEPASFGLFLFGAAIIGVAAWRGRKARTDSLRA